MRNLYHILARMPALEKDEMYIALEQLATQLVESGRMRIDADDRLNFVRFFLPYEKIYMIFSLRELYDPKLIPKTKQTISHLLSSNYSGASLTQKANSEFERLREEIKKFQPVSAEIEMKLARIIVQSTEPSVIMLLLLENVEVFISYLHTIGDMLDMQSWQTAGGNSGMQSLYGRECSVFVSCGGDPFRLDNKNPMYGDGFPALARMMVIGAQELGHYADIKRNKKGVAYSRHSTNLYATKAKEHARIARINDIKHVIHTEKLLYQLGLARLLELEKAVKFYKKYNKGRIAIFLSTQRLKHYTQSFIERCVSHNLSFVPHLPDKEFIGAQLVMALGDMKFNLAPKADAYESDDPVIEEAIAVVEALARVPQQMMKWDHQATAFLMPNLYRIYYNEVVPACIDSVERYTGDSYNIELVKPELSKEEKLWRWVKNKIKPKKQYPFIKASSYRRFF